MREDYLQINCLMKDSEYVQKYVINKRPTNNYRIQNWQRNDKLSKLGSVH